MKVTRLTTRYDETHAVGVLVLRVQPPAFVANARDLHERILQHLEEADDIHTVVIDASAIDDLAASTEEAFGGLLDDLDARQIVLRLANMTTPMRRTLQRSGLLERQGDRVHRTLPEAVRAATTVAEHDVDRPAPLDLDVTRAEDEGMVLERAKVSAVRNPGA